MTERETLARLNFRGGNTRFSDPSLVLSVQLNAVLLLRPRKKQKKKKKVHGLAKSGDLGVEWIFLDFRVKDKPHLVLIWGCCGLNTSKLGSTPQNQAQREVEAHQGLSSTVILLQIQHKPGLTA